MEQIAIKNEKLEQIENEIITLKNQTAKNIIQIGYKLIEAKEKLPHGEWGGWLSDRINFSQRTANQFMRIAKEFGSSPQLISNLEITKIGLLLDMPIEKRKEFIENHDLKTMTTREVKKVIKQSRNKRTTLQEQIDLFNERISQIDKNIDKLNTEKKQIMHKLHSVYKILDIG